MLTTIPLLNSENVWEHRKQLLSTFIQNHFSNKMDCISILEAGCGKRWLLDLGNATCRITGVDIDETQLSIRQETEGDLDKAIVGDLRTVKIDDCFDIVYCCDVIEHINGAERAIDNMFKCLKPSGLFILLFPDRNSCVGYITRILPHWAHIAYYKYLLGYHLAGKSGYAPFRTIFNKIVSRRGIQDYCAIHGHDILLEYGRPIDFRSLGSIADRCIKAMLWIIATLSIFRLSPTHDGLVYVIKKG